MAIDGGEGGEEEVLHAEEVARDESGAESEVEGGGGGCGVFVRFGGFGGAGARVDKGDIAAGLDVAAEACGHDGVTASPDRARATRGLAGLTSHAAAVSTCSQIKPGKWPEYLTVRCCGRPSDFRL